MRIALIGYGKMGKAIEAIAIAKGHEIVLKINDSNLGDFTKGNLDQADVAIEFTGPHSAYGNIHQLISWGIPTVSGSTGWLDQLETITALNHSTDGSFLYASNFSIGVNLFFEMNKKLASLMAVHPEYRLEMTEIHHTEKRDAPSGTAISLAEQVMDANAGKKQWVNEPSGDHSLVPIISKRIDPAPGTHSVLYTSEIDDIEIIHTAHNRQGFASGAVLAAEFIHNRKGHFHMKDVLGF
ncbi:MAG: 4-hydroxy-tetrahydrodipicolinate reductase [Chitinophagaceae bacterium]|nr:MAG: 4-hydroxy-tetrahydrodipicolinate reductase [Chitinophagaceae bacterium]